MHFIDITPDYFKKWDEFVARTTGSSFYHESAWFDILEKTFRYKQVGCLQMEGDKIVGGLPLFKIRRLVGNGVVSSPFRDRGGVLCLPDVNPRHILAQTIKRHGRQTDYILVKQMETFDEKAVGVLPYQKSINWITTRLDLSKGADSIWRSLKNNAQGPVKQAQKKGVQVTIADSQADMASFYRIFLENRKKLGIPSFPKIFFIRLWDFMQTSGKICLILANIGQKTIAGILLLVHKNSVIDGYAASLREFRPYRANDLLVWKAIEWACKNGYTVFDFGADSRRQKNLLAFKKKWGGQQKTVHHYYYTDKTDRYFDVDSSNDKYAFFRRTLSLLPTPVFRLTSNFLVSRFG
jgi:Acetyltransferase (GNAT) domain